MADTRISQLTAAANVAPTDKIVVLYNAISNSAIANGSPSVRTIPVSSFFSNLTISNTVPTTPISNGAIGSIASDGNFFYVCVAGNFWKRTPLSTW